MKQESSSNRSPGRLGSSQRTPRQTHFRIYTVVATALLALVFVSHSFYLPRAGAQDLRLRFQQDLGQVFINHEEIKIDPRGIAERVRDSGRMSLVTASHDFEIEL